MIMSPGGHDAKPLILCLLQDHLVQSNSCLDLMQLPLGKIWERVFRHKRIFRHSSSFHFHSLAAVLLRTVQLWWIPIPT